MTEQPLRVYLSGPAFHIRPGNTDWQYLRMLARLPEFTPGVTTYRERLAWPTIGFNLRYGASTLGRRLRLPTPKGLRPGVEATLPRLDLRRSGCDVVYAYGQFPENAEPVPVVFHTGAIDRAQGRRNGLSEERIDRLERRVRRVAGRATLVTANSRAALENLGDIMPEARSKMRLLPFLLPHLAAVEESSIPRKFSGEGPIRLLFVGREARRKGLPEVLAAFAALNRSMPGRLELTVVSSLADGAVSMPQLPNLKHFASMDRSGIQDLMRASHLLLMPSHFEGYGWVYLEALAAGTIPVASDAPIQREILDDGRAGILAGPDAERLQAVLAPLLRNRSAMEALALAGWRHCRKNFLPQEVAAKMREVFLEAKERGPA